jgi:hypothetical protein
MHHLSFVIFKILIIIYKIISYILIFLMINQIIIKYMTIINFLIRQIVEKNVNASIIKIGM